MQQKQSIAYFKLFYETVQSLLSAETLSQTLVNLVERATATMAVKGASLRLRNEQTQKLELAAACGLSEEYLHKGALSHDRSIPKVLEGESVCIVNAFDDPRIQYPDALRQEGLNTMVSLPVEASGKVIGVLRLYSAEPRHFEAEEMELAAAIAELGGLAIANARLRQTKGEKLSALEQQLGIELPKAAEPLEQQTCAFTTDPSEPGRSLAYFRALHEIAGAILSTLDSHQITELIVDRVTAVMNAKGAALRLLKSGSDELELIAAKGLSQRFLTKGPPHTDKSIRATLEGRPVLITDTTSDLRIEYPAETVAEGIASILSLPILAQQRVIGVLRVYGDRQQRYNQEDVSFLAAVAEIAGVVILNARLYEATDYDISFWEATLDYLGGE